MGGQGPASRDRAAQLEADSGAAILDGKSSREIATEITAADLDAKAFDSAAVESRTRLMEAARALLGAHADDTKQRARKAETAVAKHGGKLDSLLGQLRELNGVNYVMPPGRRPSNDTQQSRTRPPPSHRGKPSN